MKTTSKHAELDHLIRTLSHDMSANFMLLENSFTKLKRSMRCISPEANRPDEAHGQVAHVEACLQQSKQFIDDLAWLARTGGVEMEPTWVELAGVVEDVLFEQRELLAQRKIEVNVVQALPALWCNKSRLKQIVTNLICNAAHHGCSSAHPRITIAPVAPGGLAVKGSGRAKAFRIHDDGPGIGRRFRRKVFLPGMRLTSARSEGSGMGLAIIKKIVEHYGGSVHVDPNGQTGTTFVVSLPEPSGQAARSLPAADPVPEPKGQSRQFQVDGRHSERQQRKLHGTLSS